MPELPEVETSCRGIRPFIEGQVVTAINVYDTRLRWPVDVDALHGCVGLSILSVSRRAKYLQLQTRDGTVLIHLGMSGNVRILMQPQPPVKHDHVDMVFANGVTLRYHDPRRFGCWLWQPRDTLHPLLASLGPEPWDAVVTADYLYQRARGKQQSIKLFIMDSHVVVGIGNIYAAEALFRAGIHPNRAAGNVSKARFAQLLLAIQAILAAAIDNGGTTLKDFLGSDGKPGYFKQQLHVYGRAGDACDACGAAIKKIVQGQRSTFYCGACQH